MKYNMKKGKNSNKPVMLFKSKTTCDVLGDVFMKTRMIALQFTLETFAKDNCVRLSKENNNKMKLGQKFNKHKGSTTIGEFFFMFNEDDDDIINIRQMI